MLPTPSAPTSACGLRNPAQHKLNGLKELMIFYASHSFIRVFTLQASVRPPSSSTFRGWPGSSLKPTTGAR